MLPTAIVAHSARGRTRFRIHDRRRDNAFFENIARQMNAASGVDDVIVNALTGSVLVRHNCSADELSHFAEANHLFRTRTQPERLPDVLRRQGSWLDQQIRRLSAETFDLESAGLLILLAFGMVQLLRGQVAAPALTAFWYAAALLAVSEKSTEGRLA